VLRLLGLFARAITAALRPRTHLVLENLALRQQLATLKRIRPRPRISRTDRLFWVLLRRLWSGWSDALIIVKPETVVRWHRAGFRAYWRWKSRKPGRPRIDREVRDLIRQMAAENRWGAPRIHAELAKLGFKVSERTVSRYLPKRAADPDTINRWKIFLSNHREVLAGMDFFTVPTVTFRVLYVFFVIHHDRRRILHANVTDHPTAVWLMQQLREAFPFDAAPRYLVFDRDSKYSADVVGLIKTAGISPVRTSFRSPWQNGVAERWVETCRREILDHVIVANDNHLRRLLRDYLDYYHQDRCHLSLAKDAPDHRFVEPRSSTTAKVVAIPRLGGLVHRYAWRDDHRAAA
jgi:putative transposase